MKYIITNVQNFITIAFNICFTFCFILFPYLMLSFYYFHFCTVCTSCFIQRVFVLLYVYSNTRFYYIFINYLWCLKYVSFYFISWYLLSYITVRWYKKVEIYNLKTITRRYALTSTLTLNMLWIHFYVSKSHVCYMF